MGKAPRSYALNQFFHAPRARDQPAAIAAVRPFRGLETPRLFVIFKHLNLITEWRLTVPHRILVTKELAAFFAVLAHRHRIHIVEELRDGERDVKALQDSLGISHSGVSQHLMTLRAHRIVSERREGRHVFYRLRQPGMASWLLAATQFLEQQSDALELREAIRKTRRTWR